MYLTQAVKQNAQQHGAVTATMMGARQHSWSQFQDRVARLAGGLQGLGVERGDRVAILALNSDRYLEYYYACYWLGAVVVPMNLRWSVVENSYSLNDSGTRTLFVDDAYAGMIPEIIRQATGIADVVFMGEGETPEGWHNHEALIASSQPAEDVGAGGHDLAGIFYTGGTTGFPKGVMLSHLAIWSSAMAMAYGMGGGDIKFLHAAPMFHLADGLLSNATTIMGGTHCFIADFGTSFDAEKTFAAIEAMQVSTLLLVPTMIRMLLDFEGYSPSRLQSVRSVIYGASPMPEGVIRRCLDELPHIGFTQVYGQTELAPLVTLNPPESHVLDGPRLRSAGRGVACVDIKIVDAQGRECARGEVGEIVARGANAMTGYWNLPEETAKTLVDGWVHTGDAAWMDDDGFIFIADRLKDMIISGGENVFSAEVESAISKHPSVREVAVIGLPCERWGESVHAIIVPHQGATITETDIVEHCRALLAGYKCPRSVAFRENSLPLSGAGKVLKRDLREEFRQSVA